MATESKDDVTMDKVQALRREIAECEESRKALQPKGPLLRQKQGHQGLH
jgi:hypothetical protein